MVDWSTIWENEIEDTKKKISLNVKKRSNEIRKLGDFLQNFIK